MSNDEKIKELEESIKKMQKENDSTFASPTTKAKKSGNELLQFFLGMVLLGGGLFWLFQKTTVSTVGFFGGGFTFGRFFIPSGTVIIPLIIGIIMLFFMEKRIFGWIVTAIGVVIILIAIIMSISIRFNTTSMFDFVLMFGLIAAGTGLLLKTLFKKRD